MLTRQHRDRTITFECDTCGDEYVTDTDDFHDALEEMKGADWRPKLEFGDWLHLCPDCR